MILHVTSPGESRIFEPSTDWSGIWLFGKVAGALPTGGVADSVGSHRCGSSQTRKGAHASDGKSHEFHKSPQRLLSHRSYQPLSAYHKAKNCADFLGAVPRCHNSWHPLKRTTTPIMSSSASLSEAVSRTRSKSLRLEAEPELRAFMNSLSLTTLWGYYGKRIGLCQEQGQGMAICHAKTVLSSEQVWESERVSILKRLWHLSFVAFVVLVVWEPGFKQRGGEMLRNLHRRTGLGWFGSIPGCLDVFGRQEAMPEIWCKRGWGP